MHSTARIEFGRADGKRVGEKFRACPEPVAPGIGRSDAFFSPSGRRIVIPKSGRGRSGSKDPIPIHSNGWGGVCKVISGGQTGADRAGLDVALELGLEIGGWCPRGRKAEDGPIDEKYPLQETGSEEYRVRTELNVRDSDGTLIFTLGKPSGGTALTVAKAISWGKPYFLVNLDRAVDCQTAASWLRDDAVRVLNIAGPRESECPGIYDRVAEFMRKLLSMTAPGPASDLLA